MQPFFLITVQGKAIRSVIGIQKLSDGDICKQDVFWCWLMCVLIGSWGSCGEAKCAVNQASVEPNMKYLKHLM